jgi:hypothetical protein
VADHVASRKGDYKAFRLGELRSYARRATTGLTPTITPRPPVNPDGTPSDPARS